MKKTTCKNLRGACDAEILGATQEEMSDNCKKHVMEMLQNGDEPHTTAMNEMMKMSPEDQQKWYEDFKESFSSLEEA